MRVQLGVMLVSAMVVTWIPNNKARAADDNPAPWGCKPLDPASPADGAACLGVVINEVSEDTAQNLGLAETRGAHIIAVLDGTPGNVAGLRQDDVVLQMDGQAVDTMESLITNLRQHAPGDQVTLVVWRNREAVQVDTVLGTASEE